MKIAFIINPKSGSRSKQMLPEIIGKNIDRNIFNQVEIVETIHRQHATELTQDFVRQNFDAVIAVGGDGTVNETARGLLHSETAFGIIPVGSGNGLARHLHIPMDAAKAVRLLNKPRELMIDYGKANENIFFCTCGPGYDAHISQVFAESSRRGLLTYIEKNLSEFFSYKPKTYRLVNDEMDITFDAFVLTFANASQWGNNAYIAPAASVKDGVMDIAIVSRIPLTGLPKMLLSLFNKTIDKNANIKILHAVSVTLEREEEGAFQYDGEPIMEGKTIHIQIIPAGLKAWAGEKK
jgi:YegS/Rv2252/BmrU family lipid kinase